MNSAATLAASSGLGTTTFIEKTDSEVYSRKLKGWMKRWTNETPTWRCWTALQALGWQSSDTESRRPGPLSVSRSQRSHAIVIVFWIPQSKKGVSILYQPTALICPRAIFFFFVTLRLMEPGSYAKPSNTSMHATCTTPDFESKPNSTHNTYASNPEASHAWSLRSLPGCQSRPCRPSTLQC